MVCGTLLGCMYYSPYRAERKPPLEVEVMIKLLIRAGGDTASHLLRARTNRATTREPWENRQTVKLPKNQRKE